MGPCCFVDTPETTHISWIQQSDAGPELLLYGGPTAGQENLIFWWKHCLDASTCTLSGWPSRLPSAEQTLQHTEVVSWQLHSAAGTPGTWRWCHFFWLASITANEMCEDQLSLMSILLLTLLFSFGNTSLKNISWTQIYQISQTWCTN